MTRANLVFAFWSCAITLFLYWPASSSAENGEMTIEAALQNPSEQFLFGNSATIYLGGTIDKDAAQRLENFIAVNHIPPESSAILNSPGGDLFGGMELGKVIRKYNLTTNVGKPSTEPVEVLNYQPGGCYSACTLRK